MATNDLPTGFSDTLAPQPPNYKTGTQDKGQEISEKPSLCRSRFKENGAGDEIRTHDFNLGKVALYP